MPETIRITPSEAAISPVAEIATSPAPSKSSSDVPIAPTQATNSTPTTNIPSGLSKRALKRLQKEKSATIPTATSTSTNGNGAIASADNSPRQSRETSVTSASDFGSEDPFVDHLQKRIRNLQKRRAKLDKYHEIAEEAKVKNLPPPLNADQVSALAQRETVEAPLKELQDALNLYKSQAIERNSQERLQKAQHEVETARSVEAGRLEGLAKGREQLSLTVKFLRAVTYKREFANETPAEETAAFERLLKLVYGGDETSLEVLDDLFNGSSKKVDEEKNSITYEEVKDICLIPPEKLSKSSAEEEVISESEAEKAASIHNSDAGEYNKVSRPVISFLQEEVSEAPQKSFGAISSTEDPADANSSANISADEISPVPTGPSSGNDTTKPKKNNQRRPYRNYYKRKSQNQGENKSTPTPPASASA